MESGGVCSAVGQSLVQYEISVEQLVVQQLETVLKTDLPSIAKQRKHLDQLILELDTAKARLHTAKQEEASKAVIEPGKVERLVEDLDDIDRRVEQARDLLATDMMNFLSRDAELAGLVGRFLDYKLEYHSSIADQVRLLLLAQAITIKTVRPIIFLVAGAAGPAQDGRDQPVQARLPDIRLQPDRAPVQLQPAERDRLPAAGLRVPPGVAGAGGGGPLPPGGRHQQSQETEGGAGDARPRQPAQVSPYIHSCFLTRTCCSVETADHHMLTGTIKSYLRELPEPLLGAELYTDWLEAGAIDRSD